MPRAGPGADLGAPAPPLSSAAEGAHAHAAAGRTAVPTVVAKAVTARGASFGAAMEALPLPAAAAVCAVAAGGVAAWAAASKTGSTQTAPGRQGMNRLSQDLSRGRRAATALAANLEDSLVNLEDSLAQQVARVEELEAHTASMEGVLRSSQDLADVNAQYAEMAKTNQELARKALTKIQSLKQELAARDSEVEQLRTQLEAARAAPREAPVPALPPSEHAAPAGVDLSRRERAKQRVRQRLLERGAAL